MQLNHVFVLFVFICYASAPDPSKGITEGHNGRSSDDVTSQMIEEKGKDIDKISADIEKSTNDMESNIEERGKDIDSPSAEQKIEEAGKNVDLLSEKMDEATEQRGSLVDHTYHKSQSNIDNDKKYSVFTDKVVGELHGEDKVQEISEKMEKLMEQKEKLVEDIGHMIEGRTRSRVLHPNDYKVNKENFPNNRNVIPGKFLKEQSRQTVNKRTKMKLHFKDKMKLSSRPKKRHFKKSWREQAKLKLRKTVINHSNNERTSAEPIDTAASKRRVIVPVEKKKLEKMLLYYYIKEKYQNKGDSALIKEFLKHEDLDEKQEPSKQEKEASDANKGSALGKLDDNHPKVPKLTSSTLGNESDVSESFSPGQVEQILKKIHDIDSKLRHTKLDNDENYNKESDVTDVMSPGLVRDMLRKVEEINSTLGVSKKKNEGEMECKSVKCMAGHVRKLLHEALNYIRSSKTTSRDRDTGHKKGDEAADKLEMLTGDARFVEKGHNVKGAGEKVGDGSKENKSSSKEEKQNKKESENNNKKEGKLERKKEDKKEQQLTSRSGFGDPYSEIGAMYGDDEHEDHEDHEYDDDEHDIDDHEEDDEDHDDHEHEDMHHYYHPHNIYHDLEIAHHYDYPHEDIHYHPHSFHHGYHHSVEEMPYGLDGSHHGVEFPAGAEVSEYPYPHQVHHLHHHVHHLVNHPGDHAVNHVSAGGQHDEHMIDLFHHHGENHYPLHSRPDPLNVATYPMHHFPMRQDQVDFDLHMRGHPFHLHDHPDIAFEGPISLEPVYDDMHQLLNGPGIHDQSDVHYEVEMHAHAKKKDIVGTSKDTSKSIKKPEKDDPLSKHSKIEKRHSEEDDRDDEDTIEEVPRNGWGVSRLSYLTELNGHNLERRIHREALDVEKLGDEIEHSVNAGVRRVTHISDDEVEAPDYDRDGNVYPNVHREDLDAEDGDSD